MKKLSKEVMQMRFMLQDAYARSHFAEIKRLHKIAQMKGIKLKQLSKAQ